MNAAEPTDLPVLPTRWEWTPEPSLFGEWRRFHARRSDGASVHADHSTSYREPSLRGHKPFTAKGPDGRFLAAGGRSTLHRTPRRWKTLAAAIRAIDDEIPFGG